MHRLDHTTPGAGGGTWEQWPGERIPEARRIDPAQGVVQGPLELCLLKGCVLHLVLEPGQVALMATRGGNRAFFVDGTYLLSIGENGLPPDGRIYFMHTDRSFPIAWRQVIPVPAVDGGAATTHHAEGEFRVRIDSPVRFHEEILRNRDGEGETICAEMLTRVMPTLMTIRLARACGRDGTRADQRAALASLQPADLDADLAPYGLSCTALTVDTAFLDADTLQPA